MIRREQAEVARDHALNAHRSLTAHVSTCRKCTDDGIPCELGGMLQRGAGKISREAADALAAYLPRGTEVAYQGDRREYRGQVFTVIGLSSRCPWSGYVLIAHKVRPFFATLPSVQLSSREVRQREQLNAVKRAVEQCCAVLAQHRVAVDVKAERNDLGTVLVTWSSAEFIGAEGRAERESATQVGQYIAAALYLLQALRAHTLRKEWHEVARDVHSAGKLAERAKVRV
ncbi:hypothetical protein [Nonomuraea sp. NEAU-A123]|uniref:hypothetical protein n=1 Tax=Nonomuraea sp. NEAU-A123 TaxID=2839649 RepID=UPI001BE439B1|nr:hypothetical protein [Nonomuraea sp. NEAU-A123]MBT2234785.1 hypothetical protein [Nonomuraea sp. NEAU-A123]